MGHLTYQYAASLRRACAGGALLHHAALPHRACLHLSSRTGGRAFQPPAAGSLRIPNRPPQHLQHAGGDFRHRHPRLCLHLFSDPQRPEIGRRFAGRIRANAGREALADHLAHQPSPGRSRHHRRRSPGGHRLARAVRSAGHHRHSGANRVLADPHLRHHR